MIRIPIQEFEFFTKNQGLSAARNFGIDKSCGEYIYFIDSDDWIESDLLEKAILNIGDAEVLCFAQEGKYSNIEALKALINGKIGEAVWAKLYRKDCFGSIRFPEGKLMEDIATSYRILYNCSLVVRAPIRGYHYCFREISISDTNNEASLVDYWIAHRDRYYYCRNMVDETTRQNFFNRALLLLFAHGL